MKWKSGRHLFAYGSLMCADIMAEISGSHLSHVSGTLRGYRRICVKGQHYPALIPYAKGRVEGVVYLNVTSSALARLDQFEGEMYSREIVQVERSDGPCIAAETYVARAEFMNNLIAVDWSFTDFLHNHKESFRRSFKGYRALK